MDILQRNNAVRDYVTNKLNEAESAQEIEFTKLSNYERVSNILIDLIDVPQKGFRGLVVTALAGEFIDPRYDPLTSFYSCNPRSIFEQGIFFALNGRVPCGKSDPLNVAKNSNVLDYQWAEGKRPQRSARAVVDFLTELKDATTSDKQVMINFFFFRLLSYGNRVKCTNVVAPTAKQDTGMDFAFKLSKFVLNYPESGTIPQFVVSEILQSFCLETPISVDGGSESVFGTNTTSKKPADVWLSLYQKPFKLFEITVKPIDEKRLMDCVQSLNDLKLLDVELYFICRIPEDVSKLNIINNALLFEGKVINFLDIEQFIWQYVSLLSLDKIQSLKDSMVEFIKSIDRLESTKEGWNNIFSS